MSTDRQIAANRANAQKSTGFRTEDGKAASSGNAQRHRLTGALTTNTVLSWYCVILEDETAVADPFNQDFYFSAALDLAQAESHLHRVRKAEEEWLLGLKPTLAESERAYKDPRDLVLDTLLHVALFGKRLRMAREGRLLR